MKLYVELIEANAMKMSNLEDKLRQKKLKITPQRLEILRAIQHLPHHPSAELVYQSVKKRYPAVSLATVYKTLETLVEIGEIRIALINGGKTLYDTRLDKHHHFVCSACGHVEDVNMNLDCFETCFPHARGENYRVMSSEVVFHGLCPKCEDVPSPEPEAAH
jgi:Fur family transcriptional regulator, peroxide stress response regulator